MSDDERPIERRRGRPRGTIRAVPGSRIAAWVPTTYHDRLIKLANDHRVSVSSLVRQMLILRLDKK